MLVLFVGQLPYQMYFAGRAPMSFAYADTFDDAFSRVNNTEIDVEIDDTDTDAV